MVDTAALADRLFEEHKQGMRYHALPEVANDLAKAYAVQEALIGRLIDGGAGGIVGWKIGLTTAPMQAMVGIATPVAGAILNTRAHPSGARVHADGHGRLGVESEVAVRLKATPPAGAEHDPAAVLACIDAAAAAFELIDDRDADYAVMEACTLIADNSWNAGMVLGDPVPVEAVSQLAGMAGTLTRDGAVIGTGENADALQIVGWLSDHLRTRGRRLEPGQWVLTGSVVRTEFARPGQRYHLAIGALPPVEVAVE